MLGANKSQWFETIFSFYNRNLLKRRFSSLNISGLKHLPSSNSELPCIVFANHSSWWDGLVAFQISRHSKMDSFVMMEEKQLKNLFLFRKLGAFSVVRESPRKSLQSINYAINLLKTDRRRTLWIFPQGEILPNDVRPLHFYRGLARIAEKLGECKIVPLAIRYEFLGNFKPEIFVKIFETETISVDSNFDSKTLTNKLSNFLIAGLDELKSDIVNKNLLDYRSII